MQWGLRIFGSALVFGLSFGLVLAQYEDARCKCVCPDTAVIGNLTHSNRTVYIKNVVSKDCNCHVVVISQLINKVEGIIEREAEFCPLCECKNESRNTATIKAVVVIIIVAVSLLSLYMVFLMCLEPYLVKGTIGAPSGNVAGYREHRDEDGGLEQESFSDVPLRARPRGSSGVLDRVGRQQDKWKRVVQEQRRNIYDRHTMLN